MHGDVIYVQCVCYLPNAVYVYVYVIIVCAIELAYISHVDCHVQLCTIDHQLSYAPHTRAHTHALNTPTRTHSRTHTHTPVYHH